MGLQAAQTWCPGARISGLRTSAGFLLVSMKSGPLAENLLTIGPPPLKEATLPSPIAALAQNLVTNPLSSLFVCCS
jgi:hypothetical protein